MKVDRYYLEINSLKNLNQVEPPDQNLIIEKVSPPNLELNKFLSEIQVEDVPSDYLAFYNYFDFCVLGKVFNKQNNIKSMACYLLRLFILNLYHSSYLAK